MKYALYLTFILTNLPVFAQLSVPVNTNKPINFEADRAEVYDDQRKAILIGNVKVVQSDSVLTSKKLIVWYESAEDAKKNAPLKKKGESNDSQQVKQIDMEGDVIITTKTQRATSEKGFYNPRTEIAILTGSVVLTQCKSVITGEKVVVNLKTNVATVEPVKGGRVSGVLIQKKESDADCPPNAAPKPISQPIVPKRG